MAQTIYSVHGTETVALATALEDHTTRGIPHQTIDRVTTGHDKHKLLILPEHLILSLIEVELEKTSANTNCRWSRSRPAFLKVHTHCVLPPNFICTILPNVEGFQHPRLLQQCSVYM